MSGEWLFGKKVSEKVINMLPNVINMETYKPDATVRDEDGAIRGFNVE